MNDLLVSFFSSENYDEYKKNCELIVVNDASDKRVVIPLVDGVTVVGNSINMGAPMSRKKGYELSNGGFVHFHDSDDGFPKEWLRSVVETIRSNDFDIMVTGRSDISKRSVIYKYQKYFHKHCLDVKKIKKRLIYRNCMGPLGGVIFSRSILSSEAFNPMASSQDWYMYIHSIDHATRLISRPDIIYDFYIDGDDRISHDSQKKILGFLQLSRTTSQLSFFGKKIRLYYLYTCRSHVKAKGGNIQKFYRKNRTLIIFYYLIITLYWRFF